MSELFKQRLKSAVEIKQESIEFIRPPLSIVLPDETIFVPVTLPIAGSTQGAYVASLYGSPLKGKGSGERLGKRSKGRLRKKPEESNASSSTKEEKKRKSKK